MAIELNARRIQTLHDIATDPPSSVGGLVVTLADTVYYGLSDWNDIQHYLIPLDWKEYYGFKQFLALLVLAAEEELDGYPMEATNEISQAA